MSSNNNNTLSYILQNPQKSEFQDTYVSLGKVEGKKRYAIDCKRLNIRISIQGMQAIEKGFSRKARIHYQNSDCVNSGSIINWGDSRSSELSNEKKHEMNQQKKLQQQEELMKQKINNEQLEKQKRIAAKKTKKLEKTIKKLAVLDSWEDF